MLCVATLQFSMSESILKDVAILTPLSSEYLAFLSASFLLVSCVASFKLLEEKARRLYILYSLGAYRDSSLGNVTCVYKDKSKYNQVQHCNWLFSYYPLCWLCQEVLLLSSKLTSLTRLKEPKTKFTRMSEGNKSRPVDYK